MIKTDHNSQQQINMSLTSTQIDFFEKNGYLQIEDILKPDELGQYQKIYDQFLDGTINTSGNRTDLGIGLGDQNDPGEKITQIMWPSDFAPLLEMPYHQRVLQIARELMGKDLDMDFDMMINKAPHTNTPTPWHQDAAYWVDMPDKRAVSCWLALDPATVENGCMWYVPGSHLSPMRPHQSAAKGGALMCEAFEEEGISIPLRPGSCVLHHGGTLHYSRGNSTGANRRALIINLRPKAMIDLERAQGFDHGRTGGAADRKVRNSNAEN
jgi:phytanoyl-CoA hydroxylase